MNRNTLYQSLIRAGRAEKVESGVPDGFEERVLAALNRVHRDDSLRIWVSILSKAAFSSAGVAIAVCVAALFLTVEDGRVRFLRNPVSAIPSSNGTDSSNAAGDEIATVLIQDLEEGEPW
jgi:hypothetical protein